MWKKNEAVMMIIDIEFIHFCPINEQFVWANAFVFLVSSKQSGSDFIGLSIVTQNKNKLVEHAELWKFLVIEW